MQTMRKLGEDALCSPEMPRLTAAWRGKGSGIVMGGAQSMFPGGRGRDMSGNGLPRDGGVERKQ